MLHGIYSYVCNHDNNYPFATICAVKVDGFWDHFDGSVSCPIAADATPMAKETVAMGQWNKNERLARSLLTQKLPDSTVVLIHEKKTVRGR
jgi:hypothetical protein